MPKNEMQNPVAAAAEIPTTPAPTTAMAPEAVVGQLRALREQIGELSPLTTAQRRTLLSRMKSSNAVLQASINVIGALDNVAQAVGQPAADVRGMVDEANRWTAVEDELRTLLNGVSGANVIRRQRLELVAAQAYTIGTQLARDPAHAVLVPHVQEIKRLKRFERRKKTASTPEPQPSPAPGTPAPVETSDKPKA